MYGMIIKNTKLLAFSHGQLVVLASLVSKPAVGQVVGKKPENT